MAIFQVNLDWPVAMPLDYPSPFVSMLCLLLKQTKIFPDVLDILQTLNGPSVSLLRKMAVHKSFFIHQ